jgi:hypothetical protein
VICATSGPGRRSRSPRRPGRMGPTTYG